MSSPSDSLFLKLQEVFRGVFKDPALEINRETTAADINGWDSFTHMSLITRIEKHWKIKLTLSELQSLERVGDILALLQSKGQS